MSFDAENVAECKMSSFSLFSFGIEINRTDTIFSCLFPLFQSQTHQSDHEFHSFFSLCAFSFNHSIHERVESR